MSNVNTESDHYCVIARDEIPTLSTIVVDGEEKNLGILKDFSRHPAVAAFIPDDARLAMSWVRLEPGEVLDTHVHPIKSMIVVAEGHGRTRGDLEADFTDGDIILIPPGAHHGFAGAGDHGFWALSIQFELRGLYEDPSNPLAEFVDATGTADEP
jgi:quercetin dioxygenase-like cupin family protein